MVICKNIITYKELTFNFTKQKLLSSNKCRFVSRRVCKSSVLQPVRTGSRVSDVIVMEIEVKGSTEPHQVLLEPYAVVIPGEIFICTSTHRKLKVI